MGKPLQVSFCSNPLLPELGSKSGRRYWSWRLTAWATAGPPFSIGCFASHKCTHSAGSKWQSRCTDRQQSHLEASWDTRLRCETKSELLLSGLVEVHKMSSFNWLRKGIYVKEHSDCTSASRLYFSLFVSRRIFCPRTAGVEDTDVLLWAVISSVTNVSTKTRNLN
jgi:hypothetical protein